MTFTLHTDLDPPAGRTVVVVGPNGAGKTTLLRALADRAVAERRRVGVVFQDVLLFPHLTALDNVAYGLRRLGRRRADARRLAAAWLERVGLPDRVQARPHELSGGQAQRVALARALAPEPELLLLDEPLSALDAVTRPEIRRLLQAELVSFPGGRVLVTHDAVDAMALADEVVVLEDGRMTQQGPPDELRRGPRTRFAAELVGVNLLRGRSTGGVVTLDGGGTLVPSADAPDGDVLVVVHPHAVALHRERPTGSPRNVLHGTVGGLHRGGGRVRVAVGGPVPLVAEVTEAAADALALAPGVEVWASVKATELSVEPA